jgi:hypothetical protein
MLKANIFDIGDHKILYESGRNYTRTLTKIN